MLRVETGGADATASIRKHEAYDLALRLSPALVERINYLFAEMKKAQAALHQFTWADTLSPLLHKVADEWDCDSSRCEYAGSDLGALVCPCMEDERGCRAVEADELRQFAAALEIAVKLRAKPDDIATALLRGDMFGFANAQGTPTQRAETTGSVGEADGGPVGEADGGPVGNADAPNTNSLPPPPAEKK